MVTMYDVKCDNKNCGKEFQSAYYYGYESCPACTNPVLVNANIVASPPPLANGTGGVWYGRGSVPYQPKASHPCEDDNCEIVHVSMLFAEYDYCRTHKKEVQLTNDDQIPPDWI